MSVIKDETGIYVKLPKEKIKFVSKEAETIYDLSLENDYLTQENKELKQKLNWIAFSNDSELALRYLRKIGYVDFDEERKVYINKHNNEPFLHKNEQEKGYYLKDEELNDYTEQLEYQINKLEKQLEEKTKIGVADHKYASKCEDKVIAMENQQKEFIEYLSKIIKELESEDIDDEELRGYVFQRTDTFKEILSKYKEIIGDVEDE